MTDGFSVRRDRLISLIEKHGLVRRPVRLASSRTSSYYVDLRCVAFSAEGADLIGDLVRSTALDLRYDVVGGHGLGAVPVATGVQAASPSPVDVFAIREERKDHGLDHSLVGPPVSGRRALVVEDVTTTGRSAYSAVVKLRDAGAHVVCVVAVVDREEGARELFESDGVPFRAVIAVQNLG